MKKYSALLLIIALVTPFSFVKAQSAADVVSVLQKQIQLLLEQVQALQQQVNALQGQLNETPSIAPTISTAPAATSAIEESKTAPEEEEQEFERIIAKGATGEDVASLQKFLAKDREIYPEGLVTGYFGSLTEMALRKFQKKHSMKQDGILNIKTITKIQELRTQGAGKFGTLPPGLLHAPGILKKPTTTPPIIPTTSTIPQITTTTTTTQILTTPTSTPATNVLTPTSVTSTTAVTTPTVNVAPSIPQQTPTTGSATTTTSTATTGDTTAPGTPMNVTASSSITSGTSAQVALYFTISTDNVGVVGYKIYRNGNSLTNLIPTSSASSLVYNDTNLPIGTAYTYAVAAYDAAGNTSPQSSVVSVTTPTPPIFTITSPNGGEQWVAGNSYTITWTSTGAPVTVVNVEFYKGGSYAGAVGNDVFNNGGLTWTIPWTITPGSDYKIRIYNNMYYNIFDESNNNFEIILPITAGPSTPPIGHWKFDGNGDNSAQGASTSTAALTVGNASFQSNNGKFNGYLYIPTSNDYAKIPYNSIFDLQSFTIEFWFRQRSNQSFNQNLVYKGTPTNNYNFKVFRQLWNEYNFGSIITGYTAVNTGYWSQTSDPNNMAHGVWHHVAYTKNASGSAYYLDGTLIHALDVAQYTEYSGPVRTPAVDIMIGNPASDTDIDNLRIYNYALTRGEVLYNMENALSGRGYDKQLADISRALSILAEQIKKFLGR